MTRALAAAGEAQRVAVMEAFKASGGQLDRWARGDMDRMARAIMATEAQLEYGSRGRVTAARVHLRTIRRALEAVCS